MTANAEVIALAGLLAAGCSSSSPSGASDAGRDAAHDAVIDRSVQVPDGAHDAGRDAPTETEVGPDAPLSPVALVRLANWSPDAPGFDVCLATHGTSSWTGPLLAQALDGGGGAPGLGRVTVLDAGLPFDSGAPLPDAAVDGRGDAAVDGRSDAADTGSADAKSDALDATSVLDAAAPSGVMFPGISPYVAVTPGVYDARIVVAGTDCATPFFADTDDLPALAAGVVETLAVVGDAVDQGADPPATLVAFADDTSLAPGRVALRFIDAIPSVIEATFASGTLATATNAPYISAAQFGGAGVDTDAGSLDGNDYLAIAPVTDAIWSLLDANGGTTTLVSVEGGSIPAGRLATVVAIGGESGPNQNAIGILLCTDVPPIVAGETATCSLYEGNGDPVCPGCK